MSLNHTSVATVGDAYPYEEFIEENEKFNPMDIVYGDSVNGQKIPMGVVLMGPLDVPFFEDGLGSAHALNPLDIANPEEWRQTFRSYMVYDLARQAYEICTYKALHKLDLNDPHQSYIFYDQATSQTRVVLGMLKAAGIELKGVPSGERNVSKP